MDPLRWVLMLAAGLLIFTHGALVFADQGDDQYAVAAGSYSRSHWDLASKEFASFIKSYPKHARTNRAVFYLGESLVQQGKFPDARAHFLDYLKREPTSPLAKQALFRGGEAALMTNQAAIADKELQQFLNQYPDDKLNGYVLPYLGDLALAKGDAKSAERYYADGLQSFSSGPLVDDCRYGVGRALVAQGKTAQAAGFFADVANNTNSELADSAQFQLAVIRYSEKKYTEAERTLDDLQRMFPKSKWLVKSQVLRAKVFTQLGKHDESQKLLDLCEKSKELQKGEWSQQWQLTRGENLVASGKYAAAIEPLEKYLRAQPNGGDAAQALANLVVADAKTKDISTAKVLYLRFIQEQPAADLKLPVVQNLADTAYTAGDKPWAAELYAVLAEKGNPTEYVKQGLAGLARCQVQSDRLTDADTTLDRLVKEYPDDSQTGEAAFLRGRVLEQGGQFDAALAMYHLVLEKFGTSKESQQALLGAARLHEKLKQGDRAAALYEQFVEKYPNSKELDIGLYGWAWALRDLNKPGPADTLFARIYKEFPQSKYWPDATYRLAERAIAAKQFDRADELLKSLLATSIDASMKQHALYLRGQAAIAAEKWNDVGPRLATLIAEFPDGEWRLPSEYWTAEAEYRQGHFTKGGEMFGTLAKKTQGRKEGWLAMVALRRAQVFAQEKKWESAAEVANQLPRDFPNFEQLYEADYLLGRCYASQADFDKAREAYQKVLRSPTGGKTETAAIAQWMIGESYFHQQKYEDALREYTRVEHLFDYPQWQAAAVLQGAKCYEELGRTQEAAESYGRVIQTYPQTEYVEEARTRLNAAQSRSAAKPGNKSG